MTEPSITVVLEPSIIGPLLSAGAILVSALIAATMAKKAIEANKLVNRKRHTLELIQASEERQFYIDNRRTFNGLTDSDVLELAKDGKFRGETTFYSLQAYLNHHELLAVGMNHGTIDEDLYKEWMRGAYTDVYKKALPIITNSQADNSKAFIQFSKYAQKWIAEIDAEKP